MKQYKTHILFALSLILITAGCKEDYNQLITGYGDLEISIGIDTSIINIAGADPIRITAPDINSVQISAQGENGNRRQWKNIEEFGQTHKMIPVDSYTFSATSEPDGGEGYIQPYFSAECQASINDNQLTEVVLNCKVASTIISNVTQIDNPAIHDLSMRIKS